MLNHNKKVLLVDADPQETTTDWVQERKSNEDLKSVNCIQLKGNIRSELLELEDNFDYINVDCGGHDSGTMRSAMSTATHILMPFRPKRRDLKLLPQMSEVVELVKTVNPDVKANSVITQAPSLPSQVSRILEAKEACSSFSLFALEAFTYQRNVYDDADESGSSVFEYKASKSGLDLKAIAEIENIISEFLL
jgi:chromosome partitioning protein